MFHSCSRRSLLALTVLTVGLLLPSSLLAGQTDRRLDLYFIDVEGGAATLIVTPEGESILIDSGYPDYGGRDLNRILHVVTDVAGLDRIHHAVVSHWHLDHYGNHAALTSEIEIGKFWDRGIPDALQEDRKFEERIAAYRAASQNDSGTLRAGDHFELDSTAAPLSVTVATASREVIENTGQPNPFADQHEPRPEDPTDNAASLSLLFEFGDFRFLCCGDLTWNIEAKLVTPNNPLGKIDLFMVTHHGLPTSNNPVLVQAIDPVVAVMCNGPTKGGHPDTIATLRSCESLKHLYQLHRNVKLGPEEQTPKEFIANSEPTVNCEGRWVKASVAPDGNSYTVQIGTDGKVREYQTRTSPAGN
ncbi:ComEC family competence protein [Maioricimonas rarisocia]|uniref:ComEC family competence protein n=1 Tax=Maioricimonas rarisocia TaxID=2528026 RepID=A0A517ZBP7_9PLAN|nr:MBL fold metallo-hydrolase [Maioricimonas rarisocia]QDU39916.1 ComEC family competence protein [Maioricimonas rarisocia]